MNVLDQYMKPQAEAISLRQKRLEILSSNIANAGTPNFKARDIDFAAEYKNAVGSGELTDRPATVCPFRLRWTATPSNCMSNSCNSRRTPHLMKPICNS